MSWWDTLGNDIKTMFGGKPDSSDPEAPIKGFIKNAPQATGSMGDNARMKQQLLDGTFKKGGEVKKTGIYKLHKGEEVITKKKKAELARKMSPQYQTKSYSRFIKKYK